MASVPSVKGSVFAAVVEDVNKMIAEERVSQSDLERWLLPEDLDLLNKLISVAMWYDVRAYERMNIMLRDVEGGGSNEYLRECGRQTARRLLEGGMYGQLEYLHRTQLSTAQAPDKRFAAFGRDLRRLSTLSASILNFSTWSVEVDPEAELQYLIRVSGAEAYPETLCWRSDGFINEMATQHGEPDLWKWRRERPDVIEFWMVRGV